MPKSVTIVCLNCNKEHSLKNKYSSKGKYCSNKCQMEYQYKERIKNWKLGGKIDSRQLRKYLIEQNECCWECGIKEWNGKEIVLELDHIDGDHTNSAENNLRMLCPNCHSQTDTYKSKNSGRGRHYRRTRYAEGKSY